MGNSIFISREHSCPIFRCHMWGLLCANLPGKVLFYAWFLSVIINSLLFHSWKCLSSDNKLDGHPTHLTSFYRNSASMFENHCWHLVLFLTLVRRHCPGSLLKIDSKSLYSLPTPPPPKKLREQHIWSRDAESVFRESSLVILIMFYRSKLGAYSSVVFLLCHLVAAWPWADYLIAPFPLVRVGKLL